MIFVPRPNPWLLFAFCCLLVAWAYWPGLSGPLLLDDFGNLSDVIAWLDGQRSWQSVIFNNRSGIGGRPLAMASFVFDGWLWGRDIWYFKLSNLMLHLACGAAMFGFYRCLFQIGSNSDQQRYWLPLLLALIWLTLPINVSSVLYIVQRMAMLSAFFILLGLWLYVAARRAIEQGHRHGVHALWLGVPLLTVLAFFSKENGILLPLLALIIEVTHFQPAPSQKRPSTVRIFFVVTVLAPAVLACLLLTLHPESLLEGYRLRNFSLVERMLTQPRILWNYVASIFVPYGPRLGLFHDSYTKSTGLLTPWTTLPAILFWLVAIIGAWRARLRHPAITAGVFLFLAGHALESSIWPLELYFEHRNYLPSFGLLLAAAGLAKAGLQRMQSPTPGFRIALLACAVLVPITYLVATHGRAGVWSSQRLLFAQELRYNADSVRLRSFLAGEAMQAGDMAGALMHISAAEEHGPERDAMTLSLWRFLAHCAGKVSPPPSLYQSLERDAYGDIQTHAMTAWEQLAVKVEQGSCQNLNVVRLIEIGTKWVQQNPLPDNAQESWRTRFYLAKMLASQSRFSEAIVHANRAFRDSDYNAGIGVFLFQVNATLGRVCTCREILAHLERSEGAGDYRLDQAIRSFRKALQQDEIGTSACNPPPVSSPPNPNQ